MKVTGILYLFKILLNFVYITCVLVTANYNESCFFAKVDIHRMKKYPMSNVNCIKRFIKPNFLLTMLYISY